MTDNQQKVGWQIKEWYPLVGIGRSSTWELIKEGKIKTVKVGRRTIITTPPREFIATLEPSA